MPSMTMTTLCYLESDGRYLMLHRVKKENDQNRGKWIGLGGHFEDGESPEECMIREVREETGLTVASWRYRGIVTFVSDKYPCEYMHLFSCDGWTGEASPCLEGELEWVSKDKLHDLEMWRGDYIFLDLLEKNAPFFSLKLVYAGETLTEARLDGVKLDI